MPWVLGVEGCWSLQLPARIYSHTATAVIASHPNVLASGEGYFVAITSDIPVKLPARRLEVILWKKRWMEVQKSCICGTSFRCSSSKARFLYWYISTKMNDYVVRNRTVLSTERVAMWNHNSQTSGLWEARTQLVLYVSWNKLPDFMTYTTQRVKFSFHSSV